MTNDNCNMKVPIIELMTINKALLGESPCYHFSFQKNKDRFLEMLAFRYFWSLTIQVKIKKNKCRAMSENLGAASTSTPKELLLMEQNLKKTLKHYTLNLS